MCTISRYVFAAMLVAGTVFGTDLSAQGTPSDNTGSSILRSQPDAGSSILRTPENAGSSLLQAVTNPDEMLKRMSLLDPERFTMKNQYIMNFSSMNGSGSMVGTYINSMEYRFNSPLVMRMKVAYQSQTGHLFGSKDAYTGIPNYEQGRVFIPSFDLIYQPFKNTTIGFFYRDYSMASPYGNGYGYDRFSPYGPRSMRRMFYGY